MTEPSSYADNPYDVADPGNTLSLVAVGLGVLGVVAFPIVFGPAAMFVASMALAKGERLWPLGLVAAILGIVGGLALWIIVFDQVGPFMG